MPDTTDTGSEATTPEAAEPETTEAEPLPTPGTSTKPTGYQPLEQPATKAKPRGKHKPTTYRPYDHDEQ